MATTAAIGVYEEAGGIPEDIRARRWRGVYHHWDGYPAGLGNYLLAWVRERQGDLAAFVQKIVDIGPDSWSSLWDDEKLGEPFEISSSTGLGMVSYAYVLDVADRRLDVFELHGDAEGKRSLSIRFDDEGNPSPRYADHIPEEAIEDGEAELASSPLGARVLEAWLDEILPLREGPFLVTKVSCSEDERGLSMLWRVLELDGDALVNVAEYESLLVPAASRYEPARVRAYLTAWRELAPAALARWEGIYQCQQLFDPCVLDRCLARTQAGFLRVLSTPKYLGA